MEFDEAIKQMIKASKTFKEAAESLEAAIVKQVNQPEPSGRMIDKHPFQGWYKWTDSRVRNADDCNVNDYSPLLADLIIVAPDTMRNVITLVNEYDRRDYKDDNWLYPYIETLRQRVIDAGFECDLEDTK